MAERQFSFFATYPCAFFSPGLYRDLARNGKGGAFGYLFLLVLVIWVITACFWHVRIVDWVAAHSPSIIEQIPEMTFEDGKLATPEAKRYDIVAEDELVGIIDTTDGTTLEDADGVPVVVTATEIIMESGNQRRIYDLNECFTEGDVVTSQDIQTFTNVASQIFVWFLLPFAVVFGYIWRLLQALLLSLLGLLANAIFKCELEYAAILRVTVVAFSPVLIINAIVAVTLGFHVVWNLLFVLLAIGYVLFAFYSIGSGERLTAESDPNVRTLG